MSSYTLIISPDDDMAPRTMVCVDYTPDGPRITGLRIDAGIDSGIAPDALPVIDLGALLRVLAPTTPPAPATSPTPASTATAVTEPATAPVLAPVPSPAPAPHPTSATPVPDRGSRATTRTPRRGQKTPGTSSATTTASRTAAPPRPRGNTTSATPANPAALGRRPYRRAPHDLAEVFRQADSVAGIADHYQVPLHTARNWVNGARRKGHLTTP